MATEPTSGTVTTCNEHDAEVGMNSFARHSVAVMLAPLAVACAAGSMLLASAQPLWTSGPEICATFTSDVGEEAPFLAENGAAMKKMMADMAVQPTGDVDADFGE
jgi:hypothetical protein